MEEDASLSSFLPLIYKHRGSPWQKKKKTYGTLTETLIFQYKYFSAIHLKPVLKLKPEYRKGPSCDGEILRSQQK